MMKRALVLVLVFVGWMSSTLALREQARGLAWAAASHWRSGSPAPAAPAVPVRLVAPEEPWEDVIQDIRAHLGPGSLGRDVRVGFYGHGAFVPPAQVQQDTPFVAALGAAAAMEVMVLPHWSFPVTLPWQDLPRQLLQVPRQQLLQVPGETLVELLRHQVRQLALANRYATAHAAVRLAAGLSVFHRQHMTPSLAAFSNSALVLVRLGQLLEHGYLSDGSTTLTVPEVVRQELVVQNIVTFGYPLPNGEVSAALGQRTRGTVTNVVPTQCWQQWQGNFLLRGAVHNLRVAWAPGHTQWPRLAPHGPEVAALGGLLGGQGAAPHQRPEAPVAPHPQGGPAGVERVWEALCTKLQHVDATDLWESL
jgi:hypothetical protein